MLFTDKLNKIYDEVINAGHKLEVHMEVAKVSELEYPGICNYIITNEKPYIKVKIREDRIDEDIVSHELLHALNIQNGYGQTRTAIDHFMMDELLALFISALAHHNIYKRQIEMGINIEENIRNKITVLCEGESSEGEHIHYGTICCAIAIADCLLAGNHFLEYMGEVRKHYPKAMEFAIYLKDNLLNQDINNHIIFRKQFLKGLKLFDDYLKMNMPSKMRYIELKENMSISYMPSIAQLKQKTDQVFDFIERRSDYRVVTKKGQDTSYFIKKDFNFNIGYFKQMTVKEFIELNDGICTIRK